LCELELVSSGNGSESLIWLGGRSET
jgi:hypothetical protein